MKTNKHNSTDLQLQLGLAFFDYIVVILVKKLPYMQEASLLYKMSSESGRSSGVSQRQLCDQIIDFAYDDLLDGENLSRIDALTDDEKKHIFDPLLQHIPLILTYPNLRRIIFLLSESIESRIDFMAQEGVYCIEFDSDDPYRKHAPLRMLLMRFTLELLSYCYPSLKFLYVSMNRFQQIQKFDNVIDASILFVDRSCQIKVDATKIPCLIRHEVGKEGFADSDYQ